MIRNFRLQILACVFAVLFCANTTFAKDKFEVAWSHYTGWEPWAYADDSGILDKWAKKYGIEINLTLVNDYIESINLYTSGKYDACTMTNMDALTIPAVGGIDSTALIVGDFSNGNDGIVTHGEGSIKELKGKEIKLVQFSVSHYLLSRALNQNELRERDVRLVNTSDADIGSVFIADPKSIAVTWNPILLQLRNEKGAKLIYDSSKIPGEIIDMMVVKTDAPDSLKKALTGAWYETMEIMSGGNAKSKEGLSFMAKTAGGTLAEFEAQLKTTRMFYKAAEAVEFTDSEKLVETMDYVRTFSFDQGLFGEGAADKNFVGMGFPGGKTLGDDKNIKLRFVSEYMRMAAEGKL